MVEQVAVTHKVAGSIPALGAQGEIRQEMSSPHYDHAQAYEQLQSKKT